MAVSRQELHSKILQREAFSSAFIFAALQREYAGEMPVYFVSLHIKERDNPFPNSEVIPSFPIPVLVVYKALDGAER